MHWARPTEARRRANALDEIHRTPQTEPLIVSVTPRDSSVELTFRGHDERHTRLYSVVAVPALPVDGREPMEQRTTISVDAPERERTVTVGNLENFVETIVTISAISNSGAESTVACLATPLPSVPARPTIHGVRSTSSAVDVKFSVTSAGGAKLSSLTARVQKSTEDSQRIAAVVPATSTADNCYNLSIPGLQPGARYAVAISASNAGGEGPQSVFWAQTSTSTPGAVTLISASAADSSCDVLFSVPDGDRSTVTHITVSTQEPGEVEPRVAVRSNLLDYLRNSGLNDP